MLIFEHEIKDRNKKKITQTSQILLKTYFCLIRQANIWQHVLHLWCNYYFCKSFWQPFWENKQEFCHFTSKLLCFFRYILILYSWENLGFCWFFNWDKSKFNENMEISTPSRHVLTFIWFREIFLTILKFRTYFNSNLSQSENQLPNKSFFTKFSSIRFP